MYMNGIRKTLLTGQKKLQQYLMNNPSTKIPFHERYETIDFNPVLKSIGYDYQINCSLTNILVNKNIPFRERYETIDF